MEHLEKVHERFAWLFHRKPFLFRAPGRINLIGEHVDYNQGIVMPAAIDRYMYFAISPGSFDRCNLFALDHDEGVTFSVNDLNPGETWVNYLQGVIDGFQRRGKIIHGVDCVFGGDIPAGAGLSSSAALCCGFAMALNEGFGFGFSRSELAFIAQHAEHEFAGVNCGLMDQYASLCGKKDSFLMLDCRDLTYDTITAPLGTNALLLVDTRVKHSLASTGYNNRRAACELSVAILQKENPGVQSLRDVQPTMLEAARKEMGEEMYRRASFVVEEIARTREAGKALRAGDWQQVGSLMKQSHQGLRKQYEVSCAELDFLVDEASGMEGVLGCRMMGGGFGGCTINVIQANRVGDVTEKLRTKYFATFGKEPDFYPIKLSDGAQLVTH